HGRPGVAAPRGVGGRRQRAAGRHRTLSRARFRVLPELRSEGLPPRASRARSLRQLPFEWRNELRPDPAGGTQLLERGGVLAEFQGGEPLYRARRSPPQPSADAPPAPRRWRGWL